MKKTILISLLFASAFTYAQKDTTAVDTFRFTTIKENKTTAVKNQKQAQVPAGVFQPSRLSNRK